jgi:hypothetical protein
MPTPRRWKIVIGGERESLKDAWRKHCDQTARTPRERIFPQSVKVARRDIEKKYFIEDRSRAGRQRHTNWSWQFRRYNASGDDIEIADIAAGEPVVEIARVVGPRDPR